MLGLLIVNYISHQDRRRTKLRGHDTTSPTDGDKDTGHDLNHNRVVAINRKEVQSHTTYSSAIFPSGCGHSHDPDGQTKHLDMLVSVSISHTQPS
jgi:hypothetical protein